MMQAIRNHMAMAAQLAGGAVAESRAGIVRSYEPDTAAARVEFVDRTHSDDDGTPFLSGWLPVTSPWVGNGWGMDAPPSIGDQVEVKFFGGSIENGYVCGRLYSDADRPPGAPSGEFWVVHQSGSLIKLKNDGKLLINGDVEVDVTAPTVQITTTGDVAVTAGGEASVTAPTISLGASGQSLLSVITSAFMNLFNTHTHNEHDGPATDVPNQQMGSSHMTSTVKAG